MLTLGISESRGCSRFVQPRSARRTVVPGPQSLPSGRCHQPRPDLERGASADRDSPGELGVGVDLAPATSTTERKRRPSSEAAATSAGELAGGLAAADRHDGCRAAISTASRLASPTAEESSRAASTTGCSSAREPTSAASRSTVCRTCGASCTRRSGSAASWPDRSPSVRQLGLGGPAGLPGAGPDRCGRAAGLVHPGPHVLRGVAGRRRRRAGTRRRGRWRRRHACAAA